MPVTFYIPAYLGSLAGGKTRVPLEAHAGGSPANIQQALDALWRQHPALQDRVMDEKGEVRQHINLFVGDECTRFTGGLATPVPENAEITIVPAVSGG